MAETILIDTSALYALASTADEFHSRAAAIYDDLLDSGADLVVTSYVFVETISLVHRRHGFPTARQLHDHVAQAARTFHIDEDIHREAWDRLTAAEGRGLNYVDWTTVVAAERLEAHVFTFDSDFRNAKVLTIPG